MSDKTPRRLLQDYLRVSDVKSAAYMTAQHKALEVGHGDSELIDNISGAFQEIIAEHITKVVDEVVRYELSTINECSFWGKGDDGRGAEIFISFGADSAFSDARVALDFESYAKESTRDISTVDLLHDKKQAENNIAGAERIAAIYRDFLNRINAELEKNESAKKD